MAQPPFVPVELRDEPSIPEKLPPPGRWTANRPADLKGGQPHGPKLGTPGPDAGYAVLLARRFEGRLALTAGERADDAVVGCVVVALRRAPLFGRAPVIYDLELAFTLWGFLDTPPEYLVEFRKPLFEGARHQYWDQRQIAGVAPDETLRMTPAQVRERLGQWRELLRV